MMKVFETTYDGFIVVNNDGIITMYEGRSLCPPDVDAWIKRHKLQKIDSFANDAIAYGKCDIKPKAKKKNVMLQEMQPVVYAKWIPHTDRGTIECSNCHAWERTAHIINPYYCPNCGAKMTN